MTKKQELLEKYVELSKKLGKLVSWGDCRKFGISKSAIEFHYGNLKNLRESSIEQYPNLEDLQMPVQLQPYDVEAFRINLEKNNVKNHNNQVVKSESFLDYVTQFSEKTFKGKISKIRPKNNKKETKRILNLVLSDLHFGADVLKDETGVVDYKAQQEARRLAHVIKETIDYKKEHRDETTLKVLLLGDILQGNLHDPRDAAPMAEQFARAVHLLSQALAQLCANFSKVEVECQSGNHDRLTSRHHNRAVNQKWDSHSTMLYYSLKGATSNLPNISFNIPKTPYSIYNVFGQKILLTHGDTVLKPGYPGNSINIKSLENQLNKINASLPDKDEIKVAVVGHVHVASVTYLNNGSCMVTNGALIPVDEYAVSLGSLESQSGQLIFESVPGFALGDSRYIRVGLAQDQDTSLDKIIKPWEGFNV